MSITTLDLTAYASKIDPATIPIEVDPTGIPIELGRTTTPATQDHYGIGYTEGFSGQPYPTWELSTSSDDHFARVKGWTQGWFDQEAGRPSNPEPVESAPVESAPIEPTDEPVITPEMEAEWSGFACGVSGFSANPPAGMEWGVADSWALGFRRGQAAYEAKCLAEQRDRENLAAMMNDPRYGPEADFSELVEANGIEFARNYNRPQGC